MDGGQQEQPKWMGIGLNAFEGVPAKSMALREIIDCSQGDICIITNPGSSCQDDRVCEAEQADDRLVMNPAMRLDGLIHGGRCFYCHGHCYHRTLWSWISNSPNHLMPVRLSP